MAEKKALCVIWSSADPEVALSMVFMYTKNSKLKGWWEKVRFVIWGPSSRLLTENGDLQSELEEMKKAGVELQACRACADMHGVTEKLEALGVEVIYMGQPLTAMLKDDSWSVLTF